MTFILPVHGRQALWMAYMVSAYTETKMTHTLKYFHPPGALVMDSDVNAILIIIIIIPGDIGIVTITIVTFALVPILTVVFFF